MQPEARPPTSDPLRGTIASSDVFDRRIAPRISADGLYFRCRPVNPRRWWRVDGVIGWVDDLSSTGARLRLHPTPEARLRALWTVRVGSLEGEVEICNVSSMRADVPAATIGIRFLRLDAELRLLIDGYLDGTCTADDWLQTLRRREDRKGGDARGPRPGTT
jgi:hypothetical protein